MSTKKIVVTGAAGFIGSCLVGRLNEEGLDNLILVDDFSKTEKSANYTTKKYTQKIERSEFLAWFKNHGEEISFVLHIGARTDTAEFSWDLLLDLNLHYTQEIWKICTQYQIPLIYASSAATYGAGELGYSDDHAMIPRLQPLNPYGKSKQDFDVWALAQEKAPSFWAGLKFFNVYGPNEYHKARMASVVFHTFNQVKETGKMKLFRSHRPDFENGKQLRDFVYVKDVVEVILFLMQNKPQSAIYNLGTGKAQTFLELTQATFKAMKKAEDIDFIDIPQDIRDKYQYYTQADMQKLRNAGYQKPFATLAEGVKDYVENYLIPSKYY